MIIQIEIPDLEEYYFGGDECPTAADFKQAIIDSAIEKFIDQMYDNYMSDRYYESIRSDAKQIIKDNQTEIVKSVTNRVTEEILKKKSIVDQMPKKSEINNINKEWESYFMELIDKAIAKRFK